jgi:hypothetical protein
VRMRHCRTDEREIASDFRLTPPAVEGTHLRAHRPAKVRNRRARRIATLEVGRDSVVQVAQGNDERHVVRVPRRRILQGSDLQRPPSQRRSINLRFQNCRPVLLNPSASSPFAVGDRPQKSKSDNCRHEDPAAPPQQLHHGLVALLEALLPSLCRPTHVSRSTQLSLLVEVSPAP